MFGSDDGQNVLKDLMERSHLLQPILNPEEEGKRQLMLHILHNLSYDVQSLLDLIDESKNENREKKAYEDEDDEMDFFRD